MENLFDSGEYLSIAHHLRIAAEQYKRDAAVIRESELANYGKDRLIRTFEDQAMQCEQFAAHIDARVD